MTSNSTVPTTTTTAAPSATYAPVVVTNKTAGSTIYVVPVVKREDEGTYTCMAFIADEFQLVNIKIVELTVGK